LWFVATQSLTYDEPVHVIAGLDAWRRGRFEQWNDQPPLGRLLLTAPLLLSPADAWTLVDRGPSGANYWTVAIAPDPVALAWRTRAVNVALGVLLAVLLWWSGAPMALRGRREPGARAARVLPGGDRAFLARHRRRRGRAPLLRGGDRRRLLARLPDLAADGRRRPGARRPARVEVLGAADRAARAGADGRQRACARAADANDQDDRGGARGRDRGLGDLRLARRAGHLPQRLAVRPVRARQRGRRADGTPARAHAHAAGAGVRRRAGRRRPAQRARTAGVFPGRGQAIGWMALVLSGRRAAQVANDGL